MKITNKHNLPQPFVDLVSFDKYSKGRSDFTTTEIIGPPRAAILRRRHDDEIEEDVSERAWAMSGSAKHYLLETIANRNPDRYIAEVRMYAQVHGKTLGGQIDLYDRQDKTLYDWKETKVWKVTKGDHSEWEAQANINLWLMSQQETKLEVKEVRYIAFLKDWTDRDTGREGYPQTPVVVVPLQIWPEAKTREYIERRVRLHMNFQHLPDNDIPVCTPEERWESQGRWKVKQKDAKRAIVSFPNEEFPEAKEAEMRAREKAFEQNNKPKSKGGYEAIHSPGEPTRCLRFCPANTFCDFYQKYIKENPQNPVD